MDIDDRWSCFHLLVGGCMQIPQKLISYLNDRKIGYEILHHPEAFTAQTLAAAEHIKGRSHAKVVMVKCGTEHLMTVLPSDCRIDLEKLEEAIGRQVELESEPEFKGLFPDCAPGTMPPFGLLYGLTTYVDRALTKQDFIVFEAGTHTDAIRLKYCDYEGVANPVVKDFAIKLQGLKKM
jgi:Ala-tRNA(Pro) deacylase